MKEEILSRQGDIDKFIDKAQVLVQASNDVRLNTYISQVSSRYQVLVNSVKVSHNTGFSKDIFFQFQCIYNKTDLLKIYN